MFKSARVKLTLFYLAVLLLFSLTLTLSTRILAQHEINSADTAQRGEVHRLILRLFSIPPSRPYNDFNSTQTVQSDELRRHLNDDVIIINLAALAVGGVLSYWYAGRTLRPIEEAHESQKRFTADASHELRTPLANMKLENEVFLRQKKFTTAEAQKLIKSNLEEVQRLESLAGNLLGLSQYEQAILAREPLNISEVAEKALHQVAKLADEKAVHVDQRVDKGRVVGHGESLEQLLVIVLDNAIKYGPQKGTLFVQGSQGDAGYKLTVRDQGQGMAPVDLPHIFERLYRGDKARTGGAGGYGLGLSLAAEIARANHASLTAANAPEGGAIFTLVLPLAK